MKVVAAFVVPDCLSTTVGLATATTFVSTSLVPTCLASASATCSTFSNS
jgi:hypothetical protein